MGSDNASELPVPLARSQLQLSIDSGALFRIVIFGRKNRMKIKATSLAIGTFVLCGTVALTSCKKAGTPEQSQEASQGVPTFQLSDSQPNSERNAYFGQTHQHTSWSLDAYIIGNTVTGPAEAYQYSIGQPIKHPAGYEVRIETPLDFQGVTDHAEYVGMVKMANDPTSPLSKLPLPRN